MRKIPVKLGQMVRPLRIMQVEEGTNLGDFCKKHKIAYGASIRVNGSTSSRDYILQKDDIIFISGKVSGGY